MTDVLISFVCYGIVYLIVFPVGVAVMARLVRTGPIVPGIETLPIESSRPELPVTALPAGAPERLP